MDIIKEDQVKDFVRRLPEITVSPPSCHLLMLAIRSRKAKEIMGVKLKDLVVERDIIRPVSNWRLRYENAIHNMALLQHQGHYEYRDVMVRPEVTGVFSTVTPRNVIAAVGDLVQENVTYAFHNNDAANFELTKQSSRFFGFLHQHKMGGQHYLTVDIDKPERYQEVKDIVSVFPIFMTTKTSRGYHIVLNLSRPEDAKMFYGENGILYKLRMFHEVETQRDPQEPVPGTLYASKDNPQNYVEIIG